MPSAKEPRTPLDKREILHKETPDVTRIDAIAATLIDEGRHPEAIEYIDISRNRKLIDRLASDATKRGSAFLLQAAERLGSDKRSTDEWTTLAEAALRAERYLDAVRAYTAAGNEAKSEEVRLAHCPDYEPFRPQGK